MTLRTFLLPDLGEGLTEADIVRWLVAAGDDVAVDQPLVEVETAKSLVEVPSPYAGTVQALHCETGVTLDVGKPLVSVDDGVASPAEGAQPYAEEERAGADPESAEASGNVLIGYGTSGGAAKGRTRRRKGDAPAPIPTAAECSDRPTLAPRVINPLVRRLARERGVALSDVRGSGPGGLILRTDVEAASGSAAVSREPRPGTEAAGGADARTGLSVAGVTKVTGVRKAIAGAMTRSRREIPEATVWVDVDVTPLLDLRAALKAGGDERVPGFLAFASRFALAGLARFPELATRFEEDGEGGHRIVSFDGINLGFAVQTDRGLVVPAVRKADAMSARALDAELRRLTDLARSGKGTPQDLSGGTFTINNYGIFGTDGSAAIINYPEVAILGLGRVIDRPWAHEGELALRKVMQLSLVFDHRVCDGGTAGGFLRYVADCFENPAGLVADL